MSRVIGVTSASSKIRAAVEEMRKNYKLAPGKVRIAAESEETMSNGGKNSSVGKMRINYKLAPGKAGIAAKLGEIMSNGGKNSSVWYEIDIRLALTDRVGNRKGSSLPFDDWINCLDEILLKILSELGFSFDGACTSYNTIGTLYYAVILRKIILFLEATKNDKDANDKKEVLRKSLLNKNSQFYLGIATDRVFTGGTNSLHQFIEYSLETMEKNKKKQFSNGKYMELALPIAELLLSEIKSGRIKVESRNINVNGFIRQLRQKNVSLC